VKNLPVQIAELYSIVVYYSYSSYPGCGKVYSCRGAEATAAGNNNLGPLELFLSGFALLTTAHVSGLLSGEDALRESITGLFAFDLFAWTSEAFSSRVARVSPCG